MALLKLLSIAFFLLAYRVAADSCVSKPCGSDYRVTSWNPVREGSYSVYYYEVVTDGCVGVAFTDVLVQMSLSCQNCSTIKCYNSNWDVVTCRYPANWVTSDAFFKSKGISVTSGLQWILPSTTTSLRFSINVNPSTTTSAQGKIYTKGNSWTSCSVITPVCKCNVCPPCPNSCYRPTYQTYPSCTCNNCTACVSGTYQVAPCNTTSDTTCLPCRQCVANNTYEITPCSSTVNRVCNNCTQCVNNVTYQTRPCSGTLNRLCTNCTLCVNNVTYETAPCNTTSNRVCQPCRTCVNGQYQTAPCTTTRNRNCTNCTVCVANLTYQTVPCSSQTNRVCTNCTQCVNNVTYESAPCNITRNRVCSNCSTCIAGTYESVPCNVTRNRVCTNCSTCIAGTYETVPCDITHDRVCTNCTICEEGFFQVAPCNGTSDRVCQQCSNCSANEQVLFPCNATNDIVCVPCPNCANCSAIPNSHLSNNGLNCTCNEGYSEQFTELGLACVPTPCCLDCQSCGFNRSTTCLNHVPETCNYTCDYAPQCTAGTTAAETGYTVNYLGLTQDASCCSAGGGDCTCFNYQVASSRGGINLDSFILGTSCSGSANQQCDPNGLIPPPCIADVLRNGVGGQTFFTTFVTNNPDPYTNVEGILVPNLGIVQDYANITIVYQGHLNESSLPIIFSAGGQSTTSEDRACFISSITGPDCLDCSTNPTATQALPLTLQSMEETEEDIVGENNSGNANGNMMAIIALTLINLAIGARQ